MTQAFATKALPIKPDAIAPDGSAGTSKAVGHRTVEEIWYFVGGRGEMWRKLGLEEGVVAVEPGVCITIPLGTHFQFRALGDEPLAAVGVTMPPWPGRRRGVRGARQVASDGGGLTWLRTQWPGQSEPVGVNGICPSRSTPMLRAASP